METEEVYETRISVRKKCIETEEVYGNGQRQNQIVLTL